MDNLTLRLSMLTYRIPLYQSRSQKLLYGGESLDLKLQRGDQLSKVGVQPLYQHGDPTL